MARYQIIFAYDGTSFLGLQRQGNGRTVQSELETALEHLGWQGKSIPFAGRTDRGVHANAQVSAFDLDWKHSPEALSRALNAQLPPDIAVRSAREAPAGWHPRFDACCRTYRYQVFCDEIRNPLQERFAWRIFPPTDLDRMKAAAQGLAGIHDFRSFGSPMKPGGVTVRRVDRAEWKAQGGFQCFEITANAFLYRMIRRLVFLQVSVGQGRLSLEEFLLGVKEAKPQIPGLAPPQGLIFVEAFYQQDKQGNLIAGRPGGALETMLASGESDCGKDICD